MTPVSDPALLTRPLWIAGPTRSAELRPRVRLAARPQPARTVRAGSQWGNASDMNAPKVPKRKVEE